MFVRDLYVGGFHLAQAAEVGFRCLRIGFLLHGAYFPSSWTRGYQSPRREMSIQSLGFSALIADPPMAGHGWRELTRPGRNISSMGILNNFDIANARVRLGSYRSVSTALTVCLDTFSRAARSPCVHPFWARRSDSLFFTWREKSNTTSAD